MPTVTDAHAVLGHLPADHPLGGLATLDVEAARIAIGTIAEPLKLPVDDAAEGILEVADAAMERAIRVISIERGHDPREYALLAFGGAGPLHGISIARRLSIPRVVVPATAGVLSALGLVTSDIGTDTSRSIVRRLAVLREEDIRETVEALRAQGTDVLRRQGIEQLRIRTVMSADLRYAGQSHELNVPFPDADGARIAVAALAEAFHAEHEVRFGHSDPDEEIELVTLRVHAVGAAALAEIPAFVAAPGFGERTAEARFAGCGRVATRVCSRGDLTAGDRVGGPTIVVGDDATLVVPPGVSGRCDRLGTIVLEVT